MLILPALALVLACSILVTAVLRPTTRPAALLSVYLLSYTHIVLVGEITNSLYQLNNAWAWLGLHLALALVAGLVWVGFGRPSIGAPWYDADGRIFPVGLRSSLKTYPELWILGVGVALAFVFSLVLIWIVPPNNNDSLATHMSRVGYWLQRGSFFPWPSQRVWQITYPVDMQLQMFWTVLFLRVDRIVEIVQWLGALAALVAVFGLAQLLGASRPQALFSALIWATFPEIILESTTTQNDLVAGTLFAAMLYLLFLGISTRSPKTLALSGLALGLGLGTKQTLFFLMPGLAIILALIWIFAGKVALRSLITWGSAVLAAFVLFSAYMFVVNMVSFGHPMGPETAIDAQTGGQTSQSLKQNLLFNTFRLAYQSIDPSGLPDPLTGYAFKLKGLVVGKITSLLRFPVEAPIAVATGHLFNLRERYVMQEDAAWYGPLFALLVIPATFYQFIKGIRQKDALRAGFLILAISFLIIDAAFRPGWDPFQGRYFIPVVTVSAAGMGFLYRPGRAWAIFRWVMAALALVIAVETFLLNSGKPLSGEYAIWWTGRLEQETVQSFYMRAPTRMVDAHVPADATLGLLTYGNFLEYPFFREDFSRRLVQIYPPERVHDIAWLKAQGIEYIAVMAPPKSPAVNMPAALAPVANTGDWTLFTWAR